ncbi:SRPBCC family protein [uncultured Devosia sp.]|uniref:SRPBCC family protein n=1 Tax=uncultured Devosia sp. TaxID=211434 RepID=UPI0026058101|nr:SRPBCC family protein [uncultured Devosia sp.]
MQVEVTSSPAAVKHTVVERKSDRELVVTRRFNAPAHIVFEAWSKAELFRRWWVPKAMSLSLLSCEIDMRTGGGYRLVFRFPDSDQTMAFFGTYKKVVPNKRIVWTNDESDQGAVTTVTFEEHAGKTLLTFHELYPTTVTLDEALAGSAEALPEQFAQLDELLAGGL